jgi:hypothetical protein
VPYVSLSWCHRWLGDDVTVTKIPQRFYNKDDPNKDIIIQGALLQLLENAHAAERTILIVVMAISGEPLITFYESVNKTGRGSATAVWEIDAVDHRDVIKNRVFLREFAEEILHEHSSTPNFLSPSAPTHMTALPSVLFHPTVLQQMAGEYGEGSPSIPSFGSFAHKVVHRLWCSSTLVKRSSMKC